MFHLPVTAGCYGMNLVFLFLTSMYFVTADLNALLLTLTGLKPQMVNVKVINPDIFFFLHFFCDASPQHTQ